MTDLDRALISFNVGLGAVSSTVVVPVPFTAKVIKTMISGETGSVDSVTRQQSRGGYGFYAGGTQGCIGSAWTDNAGSQGARRRINRLNCVGACAGAVATTGEGLLAVQSISATDITFVINEQFTEDLRVTMLVLGGTAIESAKVVPYEHSGVTGVQQVTGAGFLPNYVELINNDFTIAAADDAVANNGQLCIGAMDGVNQWVASTIIRNGQNPSIAQSYIQDGEVLASLSAGTIPVNISVFDSFDADGFSVDNTVASGTAISIISLCIKATKVQVGTFLTRLDTADIVESASFEAKALFLASCGVPESVPSTTAAPGSLILGGEAAGVEASYAVRSRDNITPSNAATALDADKVYTKIDPVTTSIDAVMFVKSKSPTDIIFEMSTPEPTAASLVGYTIFGEDVATTGAILERAVGAFATGTGAVGSTVTVPLPFSMKAVKLMFSGTDIAADNVKLRNSNVGMGFASSDKGVFTNGSAVALWRRGFSDPFAFRRIDTQNCVTSISGAGGAQGRLALQSITPTSMVFVINEVFTFTRQITFEALGGDALLDAIVIDFDHNGSVGVQQVTGVPFLPTVGLLSHANLDALGAGDRIGNGGSIGIGVADGVNSWTANAWMGNKTGQVDTTHYFKADEWFAGIGADVTERSIWSAWNADGFDIDHIEASGATPTIIALLMNIASVEVGVLQTKTDGTDIVTVSSFAGKVWLFASCGKPENTVNVVAADAGLLMGAATAQANQACQGAQAPDGLSSSEIVVAIQGDEVFIKSDVTPAVVALMAFKGIDVGDFTTVMDTPEPTTPSDVGYVLYGDDATPDESFAPVGDTLSALADNEDVDERHPLTLILEGVDGSALLLLASGIPLIQGTEQGITLDVLSDPEEDTLFPIRSSTVAPIFLIEGVGDISIAPLGSALLQIDSENDLSLSTLETDHETFVVGSALSAKISGEGGVVTFLVDPTGVLLDLALEGSTLGDKGGGLFDPIASSPPSITISRPTDPQANISIPGLLIRDVVVDSIRDVVLNF